MQGWKSICSLAAQVPDPEKDSNGATCAMQSHTRSYQTPKISGLEPLTENLTTSTRPAIIGKADAPPRLQGVLNHDRDTPTAFL